MLFFSVLTVFEVSAGFYTEGVFSKITLWTLRFWTWDVKPLLGAVKTFNPRTARAFNLRGRR